MVAGLLSGLFGVGGGLVIVPALVFLLKYEHRRATGTSLAAIVPTAAIGVISYATVGDVAWIPALILAAGAVIGAQVGSWLLGKIPVVFLQLGFVVFIAAVIVSLLVVIPSRGEPFELSVLTMVFLIVLGLVTGVLSGLLGIGGGLVVVPALMVLFGVSDLMARGTSLLMIIPAAISGTVGNVRRSNVDLPAALVIGIAACTMTALGAWIARSIDPFVGSLLFAAFLSIIAVQFARRAYTRLRHKNLS